MWIIYNQYMVWQIAFCVALWLCTVALAVVFDRNTKKLQKSQNELQNFVMQGKRPEIVFSGLIVMLVFSVPGIFLCNQMLFVGLSAILVGILFFAYCIFAFKQEVQVHNDQIVKKVGKKVTKQCNICDINSVTCALRGRGSGFVVYTVHYNNNGKTKKLFRFTEMDAGSKLFLQRIKPYKVLMPIYANKPGDFFADVLKIVCKSVDNNVARQTLKQKFALNDNQVDYIFSLKIKEIDYKNNYKKEM